VSAISESLASRPGPPDSAGATGSPDREGGARPQLEGSGILAAAVSTGQSQSPVPQVREELTPRGGPPQPPSNRIPVTGAG
jgi:hypothetical protein